MANTSTPKKKSTTKTVASKKSTTKTTTSKGNTTKVAPSTRKIPPKAKTVTATTSKENETNAILTVIGIIVLVIVAIIIFRLTYAYFTANIDDKNPDIENVTIETADLEVTYKDDKTILETQIEPGDIITKEFEVENTGNDTGYYAIALDNLTNTFDVVCPSDENENGELMFRLYKYVLSDGTKTDSTTLLSTGTLPCVTSTATEKYQFELLSQDNVLKNQTNYYKLEIEYKNLSIDQSDNMDDGKFEAKIDITESSSEQRTQSSEY